MTDLAKQTPKQRKHTYYMMEAMRRLEWDLHNAIDEAGRIPPEWHQIATEPARRRTTRVTLRLEEDVVKFFRSMGEGYGPRMNAVLAAFMQARLAGLIRGAETINHFKQREEVHDGPKPSWGSVARDMGEDWQDAPGPASRAERMAELKRLQRERDRREGKA